MKASTTTTTKHPAEHRHQTTPAPEKPAPEKVSPEEAAEGGTPTNPEGLPINRAFDPPTMPSPAPPGGEPAESPDTKKE